MPRRESVKATVKVTLTGPDGKVLKVIEGENPDPFGYDYGSFLLANVNGPLSQITLYDPFGNPYDFDFVTPSPSTSMGYLLNGFCFANCPNAGSTPPNGPGIWLFNGVPFSGPIDSWIAYTGWGLSSPQFISGLSYSPLESFTNVNTDYTTPSSPGDVIYYFAYVTQSITNTLSSPVDVYTIMLVGAVYGSRSVSPVYIPITFYVFSPPIVFSPGVTMTVTVTISLPIGIAIGPASGFGVLAL